MPVDIKANGRGYSTGSVLPWNGGHVGVALSDGGLFLSNYSYYALLQNRCSFSKHNYPRFSISCPTCQAAYRILRVYSGYLHSENRTKVLSLKLQEKLINASFVINLLLFF